MSVADRTAVSTAPRAVGRAAVSVIVPCFNAGAFLDECLGSVLRQGVADTQVIIIDDGSTELETREVLARLSRQHANVDVVRTENRGPGPARNVGLAQATGRFVLLLDADDLLGDGFLPATMSVLEARPDCDVAYTDVETFGLRSGIWQTGPMLGQGELYLDNWLPPALLIRKAAADRVGGFDPAMPPYGEDWDFCLRLHEAGAQFVKVRGVQSFYRIRPNSLIRTRWRRPLMINRLVLNHKVTYSRLFGWSIGAREEERILRLLRLAAEHPGDRRILEALRGTRVCRQFECWSLAYRAVRRLERTIASRMQGSAGR